jgi:hypothetical protein
MLPLIIKNCLSLLPDIFLSSQLNSGNDKNFFLDGNTYLCMPFLLDEIKHYLLTMDVNKGFWYR